MKEKMKRIAWMLMIGLWSMLSVQAQEPLEGKVTWGIRANLVTWVLGVPGMGLDVSFGKYWQIGVDGAYGNWDLAHDTKGIRVMTAGVQARRYFRPFGTPHVGRDVNRNGIREYTSMSRGWFVGLDARTTHYHDQFFVTEGGSEDDVLTAGIIGGYSFTLNRSGRWGLDALLGIGYIHKDYDRYEWYAPVQMHRLLDSGVKRKLGLTTAEFSITYQF